MSDGERPASGSAQPYRVCPAMWEALPVSDQLSRAKTVEFASLSAVIVHD